MPLVHWEIWLAGVRIGKIDNSSALANDFSFVWERYKIYDLLPQGKWSSSKEVYEAVKLCFPESLRDEVKLWRYENGIRDCDGVAVIELRNIDWSK